MISLSSLVRSYLESAEYKILSDQDHCLIAHKIFFGSERESFIVWTVPPDIDPGRYESTLRASISTVRANYPGARAYVLAPSRGGFSRDMLELFRESRIKFGSSGKWGGGDVVGTFRIPNLLPVRLSI